MTNTRHFTEEEAEKLVYDAAVYEKILDTNRWSVITETVVETDDGKYYKILWNKAATEYQEDEFYDKNYPEVVKHTVFNADEKWVEVDRLQEYSDEVQLKKLVDGLDDVQKKILKGLLS